MNGDLQARVARALQSGASPLRDEVLGPLVKASPLLFGQMFLKGPEHPPFRGRLLWSDYHYAFEDALLSSKRVMLMAARGSGKTFWLSFVSVLWYAIIHPDRQQFIFSATELGAQRILENIRLEVETNPSLQWLHPQGSQDKWAAGQLRMSNGHHIVAKGMFTSTRGFHPARVVLDDVLSDEDGWSATRRARTADYFFGTVTNMVMPPEGRIDVAGTPQADQDLMGQLLANPSYTSGVYPALDERNESTWPEVFPTQYLLELEREIGSVRFAKERRCRPVSDESSLFPRSLFMQGEIMQPMARLGAPAEFWRQRGVHSFYVGVDLALSTSTGADFCVVVVLGLDEQGNRWLVEMDRGRGWSFGEQKSRIVGAARRYPSVVVTIESNAFQAVAANELKRETDLPIRKYTTTADKHSLTHGLPALRILIENNKLRLPRGDARSVELTDVLMNEAGNFTWQGGKALSVGGHDDAVFGLFIADRGISRSQRPIVASEDAAQADLQAARQLSRQWPIMPVAPVPVPSQPRRTIVPDASPAPAAGGISYRNGIPVRVDPEARPWGPGPP